MYRKFIREDFMVNQLPNSNSVFVYDAMKYLQHTAVVEHKDSLLDDIKSSLSSAPLIALPMAISSKNMTQTANAAVYSAKSTKNIFQKIASIPDAITNAIKAAPSAAASAATNLTDGNALTRFSNVYKSGDGALYLDEITRAVAEAKRSGQSADVLSDLRNQLINAINNGDKTDDIISGIDKALKETAEQTAKKGIFSKIADVVSTPFKAIGKAITSSGVYKAAEGTKAGSAVFSKLGAFGKMAKKGGAVFDLAIEGIMQLFTEIIPAFQNGGLSSGVKQIGKSGLQVAGSVGGWALGSAAGTKAGIAIGTMICPGIGTAAGAIIGAIGGTIGGLIGSSLLAGAAKKITGKSENEIIQEEQMQEQAQMYANDPAALAQLEQAVAQEIQIDMQDGELSEDGQKMLEHLEYINSYVSTSPYTTTNTSALDTTSNTGTSTFGTLTIATNPDGSYDFSVPQSALTQVNYGSATGSVNPYGFVEDAIL